MRITRYFLQIVITSIVLIGVAALIYFFYLAMRERFTEDLRVTAQNRSSLFAGSIRGDMQRHIVVPRILSQDDDIARSLSRHAHEGEGATKSLNQALDQLMDERLARLASELEQAVLFTLGTDGAVLSTSTEEFSLQGEIAQDLWAQARESSMGSVFDINDNNFYYAVRVDEERADRGMPLLGDEEAPDTRGALPARSDGASKGGGAQSGRAQQEAAARNNADDPLPVGAIAIRMDFNKYTQFWNSLKVDMILMRAGGDPIIASVPGALSGNIRDFLDLDEEAPIDAASFGRLFTVNGEDMFVVASDVGVSGWRLLYMLPATETRQMINGTVALMIFALGFILTFILYLFSRRAARSSTRFRRESEELRALNMRLLAEIEQRQQAEASLQSAEQSLEQSSKLAVIGQMSAAVGHELNQPLAAMRTYLAGVRMLLRRSRFFEAGHNLNRIEDLIDRMGSITRQMRSFARSHENETAAFDLNSAVINAFSLMAPQLGQMKVEIRRRLPSQEVIIEGDRVRIEQILVNLLRNALDAVAGANEPQIDISLLTRDGYAQVTVSDNGSGIVEVEKLFEPFYTTKPAGEGLGLGLAISASYARDMGGNLLARNNQPQGAVFELNLPLSSIN